MACFDIIHTGQTCAILSTFSAPLHSNIQSRTKCLNMSKTTDLVFILPGWFLLTTFEVCGKYSPVGEQGGEEEEELLDETPLQFPPTSRSKAETAS